MYDYRDELLVSASQPDTMVKSSTDATDAVSHGDANEHMSGMSFSQPIRPADLLLSQMPVTQCFSQVCIQYETEQLTVAYCQKLAVDLCNCCILVTARSTVSRQENDEVLCNDWHRDNTASRWPNTGQAGLLVEKDNF